MTEVVHCKSTGERGVVAAARHCPDRYLDRTIAVAGARLLICFGKFAQGELLRRYGLPLERVLVGPAEIAGKDRCVVFLPHPNRPLPSTHALKKKLADALSGEELTTVRAWLANGC
jgi:uracil-DNA glycosylase